MEDDWENIVTPKVPSIVPNNPLNKWAGEDEDDEVKESWEDEEEEKKDVEKNDSNKNEPIKTKPKKSLAKSVAEKEKLRLEEAERRQREEEENMTPEEKREAELRRKKLQEEADLRLALETLGVAPSIDSINPNDKAGFEELADAINRKVSIYKSRDEFPAFVEDLFRNICVNLNSFDLKKLKLTIDNMYMEKQKAEKGDKAKKSKGKGKAKLKMEGDNAIMNQYGAYDYDDYDDFM
ncbi:eukaryotic translation initiation factor 3 subunit J-like [Ctenocephalides felis]|uniref:eukaryotic translation initiation factor 3 subunit J-like n=1 Tax=Ctenocephalides felis TaxID=7515 RepID=UPI000E6E1625|nr:eukaryotic translation initiation factor 3 subunit J-like [Ctenocephalides felis]XP_026474235.1 eukaryotic translation initiation factor 3 subunit J-like [Ctenocephalides felis]